MTIRSLRTKTVILLWLLVAALPVLAQAPPTKTDLKDYIRYTPQPGQLDTSIVRWQNPRGQTLDLISAVHVGSGTYYADLNKKFRNYDAVLYELILPDEMVGQRLPAQMQSGSGVSGMQQMLARSLGLATQIEEIDYSAPNFVHADLTTNGLAQKMAERQENMMAYLMKAVSSSGTIDEKSLGISEQELAQIDFMAVLNGQTSPKDRKTLRKLFASALSSSGGVLASFGDSALVSERNKAALEVLSREQNSGKRRMALFYGAAHMPDLESRLLKQGWKKTGTEWVKAWSI
jgi:hypothetical protein